MIITITAGHSNTDSGAVGNGYKENEFVTNIRNYVTLYLRQAGFTVQTDGNGSDNQPLSTAMKLASKSQVAVEFHLNAATNSTAKGVEVLSSPKDKVLSQKIAQAISSVTGSPLRGEKGWKPENSGQHARLGFVRSGGVIVELEFISNKNAMETLNSKRWLVAKAIAEAIALHVKGK